LSAELQSDKALHKEGIEVTQEDMDKDGRLEVLVETPRQNLYLSTGQRRFIVRMGFKRPKASICKMSLTRRPEAYHKQLLEVASHPAEASTPSVKTIHDLVRVKEPGLEKRLFVDWYRRSTLLDHFLHPSTTLENFYHCQYGEQGDFVKGGLSGRHREGYLPADPAVTVGGGVDGATRKNMVSVEKTLSFMDSRGWHVVYRIHNVHGPACQLWFGCEMNFAFFQPR